MSPEPKMTAREPGSVSYTHLDVYKRQDLEFEDAALHEIARMALARKTGARGLRSICEDVLQQTMFDLPSEEGVSKVVVTEASVKGEEQPQRIYG